MLAFSWMSAWAIRSVLWRSGWSAKRAGCRPKSEKKTKVILYLYEEYLERNEKPEIATVERLLQLVA